MNKIPIGYIQYYDKHDFRPEKGYEIKDLPNSLAAIDFYIGELEYIGKGLGSEVLKLFINEYVFKKFDACLLDEVVFGKFPRWIGVRNFSPPQLFMSSERNLEWLELRILRAVCYKFNVTDGLSHSNIQNSEM